MKIIKAIMPTTKGPADWFTGDVYIDQIKPATEWSAMTAANVHFTPGAHTAWHTHPHGQTLYVTEGEGFIGRRGGEVEYIRPGTTVLIEPGEEHWHGATPDNFMVHIALTELDTNNSAATWGDHVTDEEYKQGIK